MKRTHTLLAALLLGLTLILAGCGSGGGSDDDGVASATGKDSSTSKDSKGTSKEDRDAQGLKFAKCMPQDDDGVMKGNGPDIAWFTDPSGNVVSVIGAAGPGR